MYYINNKNMPKSIFASKTFWFGALQIALGGYGLLSGLMDHTAALALLVTGLGTVGLRGVTNTPVSLSGN